MTLVHLRLRRGDVVAEERLAGEAETIYFCARDRCPHYRGQLGLLPGAEEMDCALVQTSPSSVCQAFYLETAEVLDKLRRQTWEQRLAEAEAFEAAVAAAASNGGPSGSNRVS